MGLRSLGNIRREILPTKTMFQSGISARYIAPEMLETTDKNLEATTASDVYSLSMTIYYFGTLQHPYDDLEKEEEVRAAARLGNRPRPPLTPSHLDTVLWKLIENMWNHDPAKRSSIREVALDVTALHHFRDL